MKTATSKWSKKITDYLKRIINVAVSFIVITCIITEVGQFFFTFFTSFIPEFINELDVMYLNSLQTSVNVFCKKIPLVSSECELLWEEK